MKRDSLNSDLLFKLVTKIMLNKELRKIFCKNVQKNTQISVTVSDFLHANVF